MTNALYLVGLVFGVVVLALVLKPEWGRKYYIQLSAGLAALVGTVFFLGKIKKGSLRLDPEIQEKEAKLKKDLAKVHKEAEATISEAAKKEDAIKQEVETIRVISDDEERLKRLAELFNKTRR